MGAGGVPPLGPAGVLSARPSAGIWHSLHSWCPEPVSHVPKAIMFLFRSRHKVAGYVGSYGAGCSVTTEHLFLVISLVAAETDRVLIIKE